MTSSSEPLDLQPTVIRRSLTVTLLVYWILVMCMWGAFAFDRGLTFETSFPVVCQSSSWQTCLNYSDELRPYNSLFLGLGYLLSFNNGSYIIYQLLYGLLWWGRGVFTYLIFRKLFPAYPLFSFLIGALVIVHASDGALNWLGQIHQFGFMFFFVLAVYLLLKSWESKRLISAIAFLGLSLIALYVSLWTYESHFFLILSVPIILFILNPKLNLRLLLTTAAWYILPTLYGWLQIKRYIIAKTNTYQTSIVRPDLSLATMLADAQAHFWHSLQFWKWGWPFTEYPYSVGKLSPEIAFLGVIVFVIGAYLLSPTAGFSRLRLPPPKSLWLCLGLGLLFLLLSLPIYLLIANNTMFWRTQMLAGFGAAICLGTSICLLAQLFPKNRYQTLFVVFASAVIVFAGVRAGVALQGLHTNSWQVHRGVMAQVAHLVPSVKDNTMILLTNVPRAYGKDPFSGEQWFNWPVKLVFPRRKVVGYYIYDDGKPATDNPWKFTSTGMEWEKQGMPQDFEQVAFNQIVVLRYNPDGKLALLEQFPRNILPQHFDTATYNPRQRIKRKFISDRSIQMFAR